MRMLQRLALLALFIALPTVSRAAPITFVYSGNNFNAFSNAPFPVGATFSASNRVTGILTFNAGLADQALGAVTPDTWSFTDGFSTFTQASILDFASIRLEVSGGAVTAWSIGLLDQFLNFGDPIGKQSRGLQTVNAIGTGQFDDGVFRQMVSSAFYQEDRGSITGAPGTWTAAVPVPEPGTLVLFATGLLTAGVWRRSKTRR